jgi:hypothetical protein
MLKGFSDKEKGELLDKVKRLISNGGQILQGTSRQAALD